MRFAAIIFAIFLCACAPGPKEFTTRISGTVVDRPQTRELVLWRPYDDLRDATVIIPVTGGRFSHRLTTDVREKWLLADKDEMDSGGFRHFGFFSEPGKVEITIRRDASELTGGPLNREYAALQDSLAVWQRQKNEGERALVERGFRPRTLTFTDGGEVYIEPDESTPEARALLDEYRALEARTMPGRELDYLRENRSEVSLAQIYTGIKGGRLWKTEAPYVEIYEQAGYAASYPDHPYTRELANLLGAVGTLRVGGRLIDVELPDLDGRQVQLSEYIAGKVALVELWMTWCGPCRRGAMAAIPLYNEFGERGFTVIGINADNSLDEVREAVEKDGYPWPTLVDVRGENGVWSRYGIDGAGGTSFVVDRDGTILAIHPTADQLRAILEEKL